MSYIRYGHPLYWFDDDSDLYVFGCVDGGIEDYGGSSHMPSVIEHIGHMIYIETNDIDYATLMVMQLADNCGCFDKLRKIIPKLKYQDGEEYYNDYTEAIKRNYPVYKHRKEMWNDSSKDI